jgi:hypothetical protein
MLYFNGKKKVSTNPGKKGSGKEVLFEKSYPSNALVSTTFHQPDVHCEFQGAGIANVFLPSFRVSCSAPCSLSLVATVQGDTYEDGCWSPAKAARRKARMAKRGGKPAFSSGSTHGVARPAYVFGLRWWQAFAGEPYSRALCFSSLPLALSDKPPA